MLRSKSPKPRSKYSSSPPPPLKIWKARLGEWLSSDAHAEMPVMREAQGGLDEGAADGAICELFFFEPRILPWMFASRPTSSSGVSGPGELHLSRPGRSSRSRTRSGNATSSSFDGAACFLHSACAEAGACYQQRGGHTNGACYQSRSSRFQPSDGDRAASGS
jgi:hypothetical protein